MISGDTQSTADRGSKHSPTSCDSDSVAPALPLDESPPLIRALLPITIPVILIALGSLTDYLVEQNVAGIEQGVWTDILAGMGNKNIALGIGVVLALTLSLIHISEPTRPY